MANFGKVLVVFASAGFVIFGIGFVADLISAKPEQHRTTMTSLTYAEALTGTDSPRVWKIIGATVGVTSAHVGVVEMKGSTETSNIVVLVILRSHPFFHEWVTLPPDKEITLIVSTNFSPGNRNGWLAESFLAPRLPIVEGYLKETGENP